MNHAGNCRTGWHVFVLLEMFFDLQAQRFDDFLVADFNAIDIGFVIPDVVLDFAIEAESRQREFGIETGARSRGPSRPHNPAIIGFGVLAVAIVRVLLLVTVPAVLADRVSVNNPFLSRSR